MTAPGSEAPDSRPTGPTAPQRPGAERRRRSGVGILAAAGAALLVAVLGITLWPTPVDRGLRGTLESWLAALHGLGLPEQFGYPELEFVANIVMFVPVGCLAAVLLRRRRWWIAAAVPPVFSVAIECAQLLFLPGRFATVSDVVANSLGGWLGIALVAAIRSGGARRRRTRDGGARRDRAEKRASSAEE
ncbi:VanZ family protein [Leucobacter zeae]|nr:VanZ family protein [Leucobacter zeae]